MTPDEVMYKLRLDLGYWQRQLRLDDKEFQIRWLSKGEEDGARGACEEYTYAHRFVILVQHPDDIDRECEFNSDYEVVLVHELLHARQEAWICSKIDRIFKTHEVQHQIYEVSHDAIAEALVRARRGIQR